jgi:hypothetical protein
MAAQTTLPMTNEDMPHLDRSVSDSRVHSRERNASCIRGTVIRQAGSVAKLVGFGGDVKLAPTNTYISLLRVGNKFGIVRPSAADRIDIAIKLKGVAPAGRLAAAGSRNNMVTHRVRISDPDQIETEVDAWLKQAYNAT